MNKFDITIDNNATVRNLVYDRLYDAIVVGYFKPGQRLLERDLSKMMGVSRTPIREALLQLEKENLVKNIPYKGAEVTRLTYRDAKEIYQLRQLLEGTSAYLAAKRSNVEDIKYLRDNIKKHATAFDSHDELEISRINLDFHMRIVEIADNHMLSKVLKSIQVYMGILSEMSILPRGKKTIEEHSALLDAIEAGDKKRSREMMNEHLRHIWDFSRHHLGDKNDFDNIDEAELIAQVEDGFIYK